MSFASCPVRDVSMQYFFVRLKKITDFLSVLYCNYPVIYSMECLYFAIILHPTLPYVLLKYLNLNIGIIFNKICELDCLHVVQ